MQNCSPKAIGGLVTKGQLLGQQKCQETHPKLLKDRAPRFGSVMRFFKTAIFVLLLLPATMFAAKLREIALLDIPGRPGFETLAFAKGFLVMAHNGASTVDVFDPAKRRFVAQISGIVSARGVAVDDGASRVYIADAGTNSIVRSPAPRYPAQPLFLAVLSRCAHLFDRR